MLVPHLNEQARVPQISVSEMRRVSSYGGPSGVAGSERLKQRLSSTPGLHLLSNSSLGEAGFLAAAGDPQDERVFHRTSGAARNFYAIASNLKQVPKRKSWATRKDPFRPVVQETIIFDEPIHTDENCNGGATAVFVEEVDRKHSSGAGLNDNGTREGGVEAVFEVPSNDSQLVEEVELEKSIGTSSAADRLVGLSDSQECESSLSGTHSVAGELQGEGPDLETGPPSIALAEVECSLPASPICAGQDAQISRAGKCEADTDDNVDTFSNENSQELETSAGLQNSENDRAKDMAAIEIQSCWRGWQERKHFKQVKYRVIFLQSLVRRNQESKQYHGILQAAVVLQKYWRMVQSVQVLKRLKLEQAFREQRKIDNAAIVVQKYWRSVRSRRLLNNLRKERDIRAQQRKNLAAVVLQKHWRAQRGRCLVKQLKIEQVAMEQQRIEDAAAAVVLQKHWRARRGRFLIKHLRMEQVVKERQRIDNAAIVLQKYWRAQQGRRLVKQLRIKQVAREKQRIDGAAVVLQKNWRAHQGRSLVKHLRIQQVTREQQRINNATIVLQKCWRAQQGRRLVKLLTLDLAAREQLRIDNAAVVLQKHWRAKQCRCHVRNLKSEELATEQLIENIAASVLQKHWRAKQGRCLVKHLRMEEVAREQLRIDNAATVVQKYWRAKRGRCLVKHLRTEQVAREQERTNYAATVVQKHWRAKQGRSYVKHLKLEQIARKQQRFNRAAIIIQKHGRAQQARCLVKRFKMEQAVREKRRIDHAAIVLQKHWRGRCGRSLLKHRKMELCITELQRIDHAAIVIQKLWRAPQSRGLVENIRMEQLLRQRKMDDATIVLQKHWRGCQSRCLVKDLKKRQLVDNAVVVVQKYWRAKQSMLTVKHLKMELAARERHRASAATILQKHWRARQSILVVKLLKMEAAVREQQRLDNAATIFQKHWRGRHSRLMVKHLKTEQASRELGRVDNAALVLQKYWRGFQSRQLVKFLYMEQVTRERAAVCIQARVRGNATRVKLKAAITIQKALQLYWSSRLTVSAVSIQHAFPYSSDDNLKIQAIIVLQAYAHGFEKRRRLAQKPKSANLLLEPDHTSSETCTKTGVAADTSPHMIVTGSDLYASDVAKYLSKAEDSLESSPSSSIVHHVDAGVKSVDQKYSSPDRMHLECAPINSPKHHPGSSQGLDGEFSATSVGDVQVQKNGVQEDWNYVAVDQLEECLDTCLATLRPLASGSQHCLPGLDVPRESQEWVATDQNVENKKKVGISSATELSTSTFEVVQQGPRTGSDIDEPDKEPSDLIGSASDKRMQSDLVTSQATPTGGTDHLEISFGPLQETGTEQMENPVRGRSLGRQTLKQNEQRLKQFAQVFLLQRHIALQQQRAQAAPPFPPSWSSGSEIPSQMVNHPLEVESHVQGEVAVQSASVYTDAQLSHVDGGRPKEHHVVCEIVDPDDEQTVRRNSKASQNSDAKQVLERPGPDVVLDMVLLLRRIEAEYGTSEADFEGENSTWCTTGCGDIEEGIPLLDRNLGSMRRESSMAKFANAVSMKHISIPDVNAVLLVFIAMVVYTRTVCKGLFFGARQTHRRP